MRILIITDKMDIGGAETHIYTLIRELTKKGVKIKLLSSGGVYADLLKKLGVPSIFAPLDKRDIFSIKKSEKIIKREMKLCDIVHTHTRFSSYLVNKIRKNSDFPKIVTTAHLNFPLFPFGKLAYWGDMTLAVSEDIKRYLIDNYGITEENIKLTKNSVDTELFGKENFFKKLIIHTSRIDEGRAKTAFLLEKIATELLPKMRDWRIMIVGDGNLYHKLKEKVALTNSALGFEGIILTGARSDIPNILRYGSIFVGVSRSALEGMAAGLPTVISGDEGYGGILSKENAEELALSNFCARGFPDATYSSLLSDIRTLINDKNLRFSLSDFGRKLVEERYSKESMMNDAYFCYKRLFFAPSVLLVGYFGYSNLGDEMTLKTAINELSERGITNIGILCRKDSPIKEEFKEKKGFDFVKLYDRMSFVDIRTAIESYDTVILCGGNLLQNETSERSLLYYERIIALAKKKGKGVYMLSSGFGDVKGAFGNALLKNSIKNANFCGCRTSYDFGIAKKYNQNSYLMPDLCFLLPERASNKEKTHFAWVVSRKKHIKAEEIQKIANSYSLTPLAILLFPEEDTAIKDELNEKCIEFHIPKDYDEFSEILAKCAFTLTERLHGAVFSILSHTPVYLVDDTSKKRAIIDEIYKKTNKTSSKLIDSYKNFKISEKKEIGAQDSDFNYVIQMFRYELTEKLNELF